MALSTRRPELSARLSRPSAAGSTRWNVASGRSCSNVRPTAYRPPRSEALVEPLNHMDEGAQAVERRIAARNTGLQGPITVTSLAWFGDDVLAPLLARFGAQHRMVTIDLINDPRRFNLSRREADIALRIGSFHEEYLVERKVADVSYGL